MRVEGIQGGVSYPLNQGMGQGSREHKSAEDNNMVKEQFMQKREHTAEQLNKALEKANKSFQSFDRKFERSVHEKTGAIMVKVIDSSNDQVIRELPPEKILDMVAHMLEVAGIIVDKRG
ncbi:flagellar protein FlaG [Alkaliphilus serpentinus]|uniref:Flagellar protein FlaG n=1 Tax=Alkaliphilus serpentinus TaxID=1482731 RepID=A0A833HQP6_9FIRM|nr:flagellar protein FlaG [Alkaliphilus serpentinus]KAB3532048.1 flagellar protein FlaG [Alkaliphilus serpentinus]